MEINIIVPAGGKSSRYNTGKPKWLRTHPDGKLMIEHALQALVKNNYKLNIYIITNSDIQREFNVQSILKDSSLSSAELILLPHSTNSAVETIYKGIKYHAKNFNYSLPTILKDSDNFVELSEDIKWGKSNFTVGLNLNKVDTNRIKSKSFLVVDEFNNVVDFIEKQVVSDKISVGTHCFSTFQSYMLKAESFLNEKQSLEIYNSHIIASLIYEKEQFIYEEAKDYIDFGTQKEWNEIFKQHSTYFVDFDGTLVKNKGKYGDNNWDQLNDIPLLENINIFKSFQKKGASIIITTSRDPKYRDYIHNFLKRLDLEVDEIICGLNHSPRVIVNDFANTNPYPSCSAISIPRNGDLRNYFQYDF